MVRIYSMCQFEKGKGNITVPSWLPQVFPPVSWVCRITSVFFGGGTPSLASPFTIATVLDTISQCACLAEGSEITLEANPASADSLCLAKFQRAGVNRLSIGIQVRGNKGCLQYCLILCQQIIYLFCQGKSNVLLIRILNSVDYIQFRSRNEPKGQLCHLFHPSHWPQLIHMWIDVFARVNLRY